MANEKILDQELLARGYKQFKPGPFDHEGVETKFQKRFDDEKGKKYFITVNKWRAFQHPHTGETIGPSYEFDIQFDSVDGNNPVNLQFFGGWDIESTEKQVEKMFQTGDWRYYELWDEA